jgi:hypothetical protein
MIRMMVDSDMAKSPLMTIEQTRKILRVPAPLPQCVCQRGSRLCRRQPSTSVPLDLGAHGKDRPSALVDPIIHERILSMLCLASVNASSIWDVNVRKVERDKMGRSGRVG